MITDLGVLEPDPETCELTLTHIHDGVRPTRRARRRAGSCAVADDLQVSPRPTDDELAALRALTNQEES